MPHFKKGNQMHIEPSRKALTDTNRALTKLVIALIRPDSEAADDIMVMQRPSRLIHEIWDEARLAIGVARSYGASQRASPKKQNKQKR